MFLENEWSILILYSRLNLYLSRSFNTFYSAIILRKVEACFMRSLVVGTSVKCNFVRSITIENYLEVCFFKVSRYKHLIQ